MAIRGRSRSLPRAALTALPTPVDRPPVDHPAVLDDVEMRVLRDREARVVRDDADARADGEAIERRVVGHDDDAVLLREARDARAELLAVDRDDAAVAALRVAVRGAA